MRLTDRNVNFDIEEIEYKKGYKNIFGEIRAMLVSPGLLLKMHFRVCLWGMFIKRRKNIIAFPGFDIFVPQWLLCDLILKEKAIKRDKKGRFKAMHWLEIILSFLKKW